MALSDLQRTKLLREFAVLDSDENGYLEWSDFERLASRLAEGRGVSAGDTAHTRLVGALRRYWDILSATADRDFDYRVSAKEYLAFYDHLVLQAGIASPDDLPPWFREIVSCLFEMLDDNGDGVVGRDEFALFLRVHDVPAEELGPVFSALDRDGNGVLDRDEVRRLVHEFYFSHDPDAPGNLLYGRL